MSDVGQFHGWSLAEKLVSRRLVVSHDFGEDEVGRRAGHPFQTVAAALAAALPGDVVDLAPGEHVVGPLTLPQGVSLRGVDLQRSRLVMSDLVADTTGITLGLGGRLSNLALVMSSTQHVRMVGVHFAGGSTGGMGSFLDNVVVSVVNSGAGDAGTSEVIGVLSDGNGQPSEFSASIKDGTVFVASCGQGRKRAVLVNGPNKLPTRGPNFVCRRVGSGTGSYVGVETDHAAALFLVRGGYVEGASEDIQQTAGTIELGATRLFSGRTGGKSFRTTQQSAVFSFWDASAIRPNSSRSLRAHGGVSEDAADELWTRVNQPVVLRDFRFDARVAPGPGASATMTLRRRVAGVASDTTGVVTIAGSNTQGENLADAVTLSVGDEFCVRCVNSAGSRLADVRFTCSAY